MRDVARERNTVGAAAEKRLDEQLHGAAVVVSDVEIR
jgi:hypothetical protein